MIHVKDDRMLRQVRMGCDILESYPEMLGKICVVHAPSFFSILFKLVKPFLPARTAEKIMVVAGDKKSTVRSATLVAADHALDHPHHSH